VQQATSNPPLTQELYLRKNCINDLREIRYLTKLPSLKVLWLHDNPCALVDNYREIVIHHLPNLVKLDNNIITAEEKNEAQKAQFNLIGDMENESNLNTPPPFEKQASKPFEEKKSRPSSEMPYMR
jgi:cilla- and flagella-associated protein